MTLDKFGERKVILDLMVLLYNYQTYKVGINHIQNSYMINTLGFQSYIRSKGFHAYQMSALLSVTANAVFD